MLVGGLNIEDGDTINRLLKDSSILSLIDELLEFNFEPKGLSNEMNDEHAGALKKCFDAILSIPKHNYSGTISTEKVDEILVRHPLIQDLYGEKNAKKIIIFLLTLNNYRNPCNLPHFKFTNHFQNNIYTQNYFLRKLFDSFLGIESEYFTYSHEKSQIIPRFSHDLHDFLPEVSIMYSILRLGTYYQKTIEILSTKYYMCNQSLYVKLLFSAVNDELQQYVTCIVSDQEKIGNDNKSPISLIYLYDLSLQHTKKLQTLSYIVERCYEKKYYEILTYLHNYALGEFFQGNKTSKNNHSLDITDNSSPPLCIAGRFKEVFAVFFKALRAWIFDGDIIHQDELFIIKDCLSNDNTDIWTSKYALCTDVIPSFVEKNTAFKILYIGKTCNLMSALGSNSIYTNMVRSIIPCDSYDSFNISNFAKVVDEMTPSTITLLNDTVKKVCNILCISKFLQNILLLSNLPFTHSLIAEMTINMTNKASKHHFKDGAPLSIYHIILSTIPSSLSKLYAKNINVSFIQSCYGQTSMMDFILISYTANFPESLFLSQPILKIYEKSFVFIWSITRLRYVILESSKERLKLIQTFSKILPKITERLRKISVCLYKMSSFLTKLLQYIIINCLELNWNKFKCDMEKANNFDGQLKYYEDYVNRVYDQVFFHNSPLLTQIHKLLSLIKICIGSSKVIQLQETRILLNDESYEAFHLELMKHESIILEEIESQSVTCGLNARLEVCTDSELEEHYSKFEESLIEFEDTLKNFEKEFQEHCRQYP